MNRVAAFALLCCATATGLSAENGIEADFRGEGTRFDASCVHPMGSFLGAVGGCASELFTDHPLHIAVGSLAPQNGFGTGLALVTHYTPNEDWRLFWDFDAIATPNLSWRAGGYMTAVLIRHPKIVVIPGGGPKIPKGPSVQEMPAFHLYSQTTSLNQLSYFGLGPNSPRTEQSFFRMRETIVGTNAVWPVFAPLGLSLFGEVNGRFTSLGGVSGQSSPSIQQLYTEATAPGLVGRPAFAQFGEGVQLGPSFANGYVRLQYSIGFQEWVSGTAGYSFRRFSTDLNHQIPLYKKTRSLKPQEFNGPDSCLESATAKACPPITRNLEGSVGFEFLYTASFVPGANTVPFYADPTLGGSDINGTSSLASYPDYRFRGPDLLLLRGSFEHSIYKFPVGAKFMVDEGRVALTHDDLGFNHLAHSYAAGLTFHAGGLPVLELLFAWGGHQGVHTIASVSNALLGSGGRPSLF